MGKMGKFYLFLSVGHFFHSNHAGEPEMVIINDEEKLVTVLVQLSC